MLPRLSDGNRSGPGSQQSGMYSLRKMQNSVSDRCNHLRCTKKKRGFCKSRLNPAKVWLLPFSIFESYLHSLSSPSGRAAGYTGCSPIQYLPAPLRSPVQRPGQAYRSHLPMLLLPGRRIQQSVSFSAPCFRKSCRFSAHGRKKNL